MQDELDKYLRSCLKTRSQPPRRSFSPQHAEADRKAAIPTDFHAAAGVCPGSARCAFLSPLLVRGSMVLSGGLNAIVCDGQQFCKYVPGISTSALCALLLLFFKQKIHFRFAYPEWVRRLPTF